MQAALVALQEASSQEGSRRAEPWSHTTVGGSESSSPSPRPCSEAASVPQKTARPVQTSLRSVTTSKSPPNHPCIQIKVYQEAEESEPAVPVWVTHDAAWRQEPAQDIRPRELTFRDQIRGFIAASMVSLARRKGSPRRSVCTA